MSLTYFKRYQMELDLQFFDIPSPELSPGYRFVPWSEADLEKHAEIKYQSFCNEIDANVFSCFRELEGCQRLLQEITSRNNFLPDARMVFPSLDSCLTTSCPSLHHALVVDEQVDRCISFGSKVGGNTKERVVLCIRSRLRKAHW